MTKGQIASLYMEEESQLLGSSQMLSFAFGVLYAMHGHDIPPKHYPTEHTKFLAEQWKGLDIPVWMIAMWGARSFAHLHKKAMTDFGCEFDTWFSENRLLNPSETLASEYMVSNGGTFRGERCSQCGKTMSDKRLCAPCFSLIMNLDPYEWAKFKNLTPDESTIWDHFPDFSHRT